jgi:hypothetical protein
MVAPPEGLISLELVFSCPIYSTNIRLAKHFTIKAGHIGFLFFVMCGNGLKSYMCLKDTLQAIYNYHNFGHIHCPAFYLKT